ncbi:MAG: pyridoxal phosphate-dependent decarboxylase family protein [Longimicrobiales bacterium]
MTERRYPLEPSQQEMQEMLAEASRLVVDHISTLSEQPAAYATDGRSEARALAEPLPEGATDFDSLMKVIFEDALPTSFNSAGPGYLAYIPGGGLFPSAVADLVANAINRYVGVWVAAPGLVQLELNVVRWFCTIVGYGPGSGGILTSGGSLANLTAIVTARRERLPEEFWSGTMYTSDQTHHSVRKAAVLAGFPESNLREIPTNAVFEMRVDALEAQIAADREAGLEPFLVVASAGTTNTGAVDPLSEIADLAEREKLWLHVDGAYGAPFMLTERGRTLMDGLSRANSVTLDPHKGLFLPYGTGALLVRDEHTLRRAHATFADYMPVMQHDADFVDFCDISPELSRDFRGLRAWLPIKLFGIDAFRDALDEKMDLARWAAEELRGIPDMEIVAEARLSLTAFRLAPAGMGEEELGALNRDLLARVNAKQNVYLTATTVDGRFLLRICVLSFRTHMDRIEQCLADIREATAEMSAPS